MEQAQNHRNIGEYKLLMIATLAVIPLLLILKKTTNSSTDHHAVLE